MEIKIPYSRRDRAKQFDSNCKRRNVLVIHRRGGKSTHMINKLIKNALTKPYNQFPDGVHAYIAPTYKQAKAIIREQLKYYTQNIPGVIKNESELKVILPNNHQIRLFGADNPDSLRGLKFWEAIFDEYAQQPGNIFSEIIRPGLSDTKGGATRIGTPKGKNSFFEVHKIAQQEMRKGNDRYTTTLKASQSGIIDIAELEDAKLTMTEDEYQQEYECSREAAIKGAYYARELNQCFKDNRIVKSVFDPILPVYTFRDLGMNDHTAIIFAQMYGNEIRIVDEYSNHGLSLAHYTDYIRGKPYSYQGHYFPHDIRVTELGTGISRLELVRKALGFSMCNVTPNMGINDGINIARLLFRNMYFDEEKTQELRNCLNNYHQERYESKGVFKDKPFHDRSSHFADAFRYLAINIKDIQNKSSNNFNEAIVPNYDHYLR